MMPAVLSVISDSSSAGPSFFFPLPVSVNRAAPDLATSNTKEKQLQQGKLNIPADALHCECVSEYV